MTRSQRFNALMASDHYEDARALAILALVSDPDDHWWLTAMSSATYELRDYKEALQLARKAERLTPHCLWTLWHKAGPLMMLDRVREAKAVYRKILRLLEHPERLPCQESNRWNAKMKRDVLEKMAEWEAGK